MIYTVNAATLGISKYQGLTPVGIAYHGGKTLFALSSGLVEQTGDDDDGEDIDAYIETGDLNFGDPDMLKYCNEIQVFGTAPGGLSLEATNNEDGTATTTTYAVTATSGSERRSKRQKLGRGARGDAWSFKLSNVDGGDMVIQKLSAVITPYQTEV